jgi:DNA uptake protein ComE-like DNA-binding protein
MPPTPEVPAPAPEVPAAAPPGPNGERAEAPAPAPTNGPDQEGLVALNQATAEELEEMGLPASQVYRVLAYRERVGAFLSVEELDEVPDLPGDHAARLKARLARR